MPAILDHVIDHGAASDWNVFKMTTEDDNLYIGLDQLQIGVYIHLDLGWLDHPFPFPSFKIKSADQIAKIRRLGLERLRYEPGKSDVQPLPVDSPPPVLAANPAVAGGVDDYVAFMESKRARQEALKQQRDALESAEKKYQNVASAVKSISTNLFSRPEECVKAAGLLVDQMVQSVMIDRDIAMHLMGSKRMGEEMYFHSLNVSVLAMMLAKELKYTREAITQLGMAGLFHDIGKVNIPDKILLKVDPLTKAEKDFYEQHCAYGYDIGKKMNLAPAVLNVITQHHEHADGTGYPRGLRGEQISALAKVICIVNVYDNLCNHLVPSRSLTPHEALSLMYSKLRAQFDPAALSQFIRVMGVYPPGTVVSLNNDMLGIVTTINVGKPLKPCVMVYDAKVPVEQAPIIDLDVEAELNITKSLRPAQLPREVYEYLSPRKNISYFFDASRRGTPPGKPS